MRRQVDKHASGELTLEERGGIDAAAEPEYPEDPAAVEFDRREGASPYQHRHLLKKCRV
jgi:hypothetical protein